jgi:hypothetical protein
MKWSTVAEARKAVANAKYIKAHLASNLTMWADAEYVRITKAQAKHLLKSFDDPYTPYLFEEVVRPLNGNVVYLAGYQEG